MLRSGTAIGLLRRRRAFTVSACGRPPPTPLPSTPSTFAPQFQTTRGKKDETNLSALFKPVPVKPSPGDVTDVVGAELCGQLDKGELLKLLNRFTQKRETKLLCQENGLDSEYNNFMDLILR